jgi:peptidoglycan/LPS O-acetylase OafA/YrhL
MLILGVTFPFEGRILLIFPFALAMVLEGIVYLPRKIFDFYKWDLSFGVYIWAWPLSQVTVVLSHGNLQHTVYLLIITSVTMAFATISWITIEQPALRHR